MEAKAVARGKKIFVVTGGGHDRYPDPEMKHRRTKVKRLRHKLPEQIDMVVCGTGQRQRQIAELLELYPNSFTVLAGTADSLQKGKKGICMVVFADGARAPASIVTSADDIRDAVRIYVRNTLPHNTVVCASKSFLYALQSALGIRNEILPATVYRIDVDNGGHINITKL